MTKAKPMRQTPKGYEPCEASAATHIQLHLPGPLPNRILRVILPARMLPVMGGETQRVYPSWEWNGSIDKPTLWPSVLSKGGDATGEHVCHSWITDGMVQFLSDCTHQYAGMTLHLLDVD